ncbi:MAG: type II toxin-antitoxin system PemK/MazF family toxin [Actinomycetota bacterium]|nr:type II toxin-antitoxin system PemK/MazF family toxin [Actinomycetota bacterium]
MKPAAIHRGDVWWADVPGDKRRPVLVVTRERFVPKLNALLVAPVTSTVRGIPTEVPMSPDDGMPRACAANFDNTFTLGRDRFDARITSLPPARLDEICEAYRFAGGC